MKSNMRSKRKGKRILAGLMVLGIFAAAPMAVQADLFAPVSVSTVEVNLNPNSGQDTDFPSVSPDTVNAEVTSVAAAQTATITPTGIRADSVFNTRGYANLVQNPVMSNPYMDWYEDDNVVLASRQVALMDRSGNVLLPYRKSYNNYYCYSDGVISLTGLTSYTVMDEEVGMKDEGYDDYYYYDLAGNELFRVAQHVDAADGNGTGYSNYCGPIGDGYGILIEEEDWSYEKGSSSYVYIINSRGEKVKQLTGEYAYQEGTGDVVGNAYYMWEVGPFRNGLAQVMDWGETHVLGYMNPNGEMAIDLSAFDYIKTGSFETELTWAGNGGALGFIDKSGNLVIPYQYEYAWPFTADGVAGVQKDGKWGFIDSANNTVIPFMYDYTFGMYNGVAAVELNGKYGYIDRNNQVIVPLEYDDISSFESGVGYAIKDGYVYIITL